MTEMQHRAAGQQNLAELQPAQQKEQRSHTGVPESFLPRPRIRDQRPPPIAAAASANDLREFENEGTC